MALWKKILLRSAGFGAAFALVLVAVIAAYSYWSERPKQWTSTAITAKPTELSFVSQSDELHLRFRYALTNNTKDEYQVVSPDLGALMKRLPEDSSLDKLEGSAWDGTLRIPPKQTVNVTFDVPLKLSSYKTTSKALNGANPISEEATPEYMKFVGNRLKEINGLVLLDYTNRYRIELPKNWDLAK